MQDWTAGDEVTATKLNEIYQGNGQVYTYGETIAINDAVYLKASDSKVYKTDSDYSDERVEFLGFAKEAGNADDTGFIQTSGKVSGLSSLTAGAFYFLSGTAGGIASTASTNRVKVGRAVSTTEIFIDKDKITSTCGTTTMDISADTTVNIAHGLGRIPKKIKISALMYAANVICISHGVFNGVTQGCIYCSTGNLDNNNDTVIIYIITEAGAYNYSIISVDITNIILTRTKVGLPTGTVHLLWEAE